MALLAFLGHLIDAKLRFFQWGGGVEEGTGTEG